MIRRSTPKYEVVTTSGTVVLTGVTKTTAKKVARQLKSKIDLFYIRPVKTNKEPQS